MNQSFAEILSMGQIPYFSLIRLEAVPELSVYRCKWVIQSFLGQTPAAPTGKIDEPAGDANYRGVSFAVERLAAIVCGRAPVTSVGQRLPTAAVKGDHLALPRELDRGAGHVRQDAALVLRGEAAGAL